MGTVIPFQQSNFVICVSYSAPDGTSELDEYAVSDYRGTESKTAYKQLKDDVIAKAAKVQHLYWISVNIVIGKQLVSCMTGSLDWFESVEYFKKIVGGMGGDEGMEPVSFGFIDQKHKIRVELENGVLALSELK